MTGDWPSWATQRVEIEEPDPGWAVLADELAAELAIALEPWLDGSISHVGSTAVPGLAAKPVVDLMAPVISLREAAEADPVLADLGWQLVPPELDGRPWRRFHVLPEEDRRRAHLQLVERVHPRWRETLAFRDALRQDPSLAAEYARIKRAAAAEHATDREAYTAAKSAFVQRVTRGARGRG